MDKASRSSKTKSPRESARSAVSLAAAATVPGILGLQITVLQAQRRLENSRTGRGVSTNCTARNACSHRSSYRRHMQVAARTRSSVALNSSSTLLGWVSEEIPHCRRLGAGRLPVYIRCTNHIDILLSRSESVNKCLQCWRSCLLIRGTGGIWSPVRRITSQCTRNQLGYNRSWR